MIVPAYRYSMHSIGRVITNPLIFYSVRQDKAVIGPSPRNGDPVRSIYFLRISLLQFIHNVVTIATGSIAADTVMLLIQPR